MTSDKEKSIRALKKKYSKPEQIAAIDAVVAAEEELAELEAKSAVFLAAYEQAQKEADHIIRLMKKDDFFEACIAAPPISILGAFALLEKAGDSLLKNALSKHMKTLARKKRPNRNHSDKSRVKEYFERWQEKPETYENQTAFINDMVEKTSVGRTETIRQWLKEWNRA